MIVYFNVCNHCGTQTQISEGAEDVQGFEFTFYTFKLKDSIRGQKPWPGKYKSGTFCDVNCLIEFLKNNLDSQGRMIE